MRPSIMSDGATMSTPASRVSERLLLQYREGLVVEHIAGLVDEAVLPMARVGIERDVGDDADFRKALLQFAHAARHQALGIEGLLGVGGLQRGVDHRKERDRRNAECERLLDHREQVVDAAARRRRASKPPARGALLPSRTNTGRIRSSGARRALAHQAAREFVAAHAAHAAMRETCPRRRSLVVTVARKRAGTLAWRPHLIR